MAPGAPAQVFVARHGARMDQADAKWQLSSPTPYDPPLTYGGWQQSLKLGNRIASLVVKRLQDEYDEPSLTQSIESLAPASKEAASTWTPGGAAQTRESPKVTPLRIALSPEVTARLCAAKIIIHTSPFLRCIQTSIGVASGISQQLYSLLPHPPASHYDEQHVAPIPTLRMDAWLGEWLCKDYFDHITPPPVSRLMCATAMVDLTRPSSAGALKGQVRNIEKSIREEDHAHSHHAHAHSRAHSLGYVPPNPTYAIGLNDAIPRGYVSHAREHIDIDHDWDPLRFGDGGDYGEEWGKMHKRLKKGFEKTVEEYKSGNAERHPTTSGLSSSERLRHTSFDSMKKEKDASAVAGDVAGLSITTNKPKTDAESETIIIFVTHAAGCNALLGAMTHAPVLIDFSVASLTMGVLTDKGGYEVNLKASTSHLVKNKPSASPNMSSMSTPPLSPQPRGKRKGSMNAGGFSLYNRYDSPSSVLPTSGSAMSTVFGSSTNHNSGIRRTASAAAATKGLWSRPEDIGGGGSSDEGAIITDEEESDSSRPSTAKGDADKEKKPTPGTWTKPGTEIRNPKMRQPVVGTGLFQAPVKPKELPQVTVELVNESKPIVKKTSGLFQPKDAGANSAVPVAGLGGAAPAAPAAGLWGGTELPERKRRWTVDQGNARP